MNFQLIMSKYHGFILYNACLLLNQHWIVGGSKQMCGFCKGIYSSVGYLIYLLFVLFRPSQSKYYNTVCYCLIRAMTVRLWCSTTMVARSHSLLNWTRKARHRHRNLSKWQGTCIVGSGNIFFLHFLIQVIDFLLK